MQDDQKAVWSIPEILKIGQSSHKMYSNDILKFQESKTILNACTKNSGNLLKAPLVGKITIICEYPGGSPSKPIYL